ncbi:class I SAM-dependent methyltransferase [Bradyrhizobium oligotrophicum S58]
MNPNYRYVFDRAVSASGTASPKVLDYGCGRGEVVTFGRSMGYEFFGVDRDAPASERPSHFQPLDGTRIQFDDAFFDVVISNQVFEHVADPPAALAEIARVLKPGGVFIALFPSKAAWFEGHVGLYFVHRMHRDLAKAYLAICHRLGFGYYREGKSARAWADFMLHQLETDVFYHSPADLKRWWTSAFGSKPVAIEHDFILHRLSCSPRLRSFSRILSAPIFKPITSFICQKRAGIVWRTTRSPAECDCTKSLAA